MNGPQSSSLGPLTARRLAAEIGGRFVPVSEETAVLTGISHDSRLVESGSLFCCVRGQHDDGHRHAAQAVAAGAVAVLVERELQVPVPQIVVPDTRAAMGPASAAVWNHPWHRCTLIGVTGTSGKTTVSHAIAAIAQACGISCEVIGTLSGTHTTPEAPVLYRQIDAAANAGAAMVVMEVSSHALDLGRVNGARFAASVFTNLSHEHLDHHGTMERYFAAKARLFDGRSDIAVINVADSWGRTLAGHAAGTTDSVVPWQPSDVAEVVVTQHGLSGVWRNRAVRCGLLGRLNAANVAAAAATASAIGLDDDAVASGVSAIAPIRGRSWPVNGPDDDICVLIDFAHKPDALDAALSSARELCAPTGKLWAVFGAGGNRDASKRAPMGAAADRYADVIVLTTDNPRDESPAAIAEAITAGIGHRASDDGRLYVELDRAGAISLAIQSADAGDVVMVAGKGHETTQQMADQSIPFDDAEVAAAELHRRRGAHR